MSNSGVEHVCDVEGITHGQGHDSRHLNYRRRHMNIDLLEDHQALFTELGMS